MPDEKHEDIPEDQLASDGDRVVEGLPDEEGEGETTNEA